jgi:hypothetical protein
LPLVGDVPSLFSISQRLLLFSKNRSIFKTAYEKKKKDFKLHLTSQRFSVDTISEFGHLQRFPQRVTKWFAPAPLDVTSYGIELKMEIKV